MHLDVHSLAALTARHQADIRRQVAGYRLAQQVAAAQGSRCTSMAQSPWSSLHRWVALIRRFLAGPARWPTV
jgi:hypothetical protein